MKFNVSSGELLTRLQAQSRAIDSKSQIQELENFLFEISANNLTITASDSETTIISDLTINNLESDGRFTISGVKLIEYLKKLPEQPVTFTVTPQSDNGFLLEISTASGKNSQVAKDASAYPLPPMIDAEHQSLSIDADALIAGISKTAFAASSDDLRPIMTGIYFDVTPGAITFVATDSHKLARLIRTDVNADTECSFVLSKKAANLIKSVIMKNDGQINIEFDSKNAVFVSNNYRIYSRHIQGNYPQYKSVIPANNPFKVVVNRGDLVNTIARVSLFTDGTGLVKFDIDTNIMKVSAQDCNFNCSADEAISCQYEGMEMCIGFKSNFFTDILANMESTDIEMQLSDPSRPGVLVPSEQKENEDMLMLIMPMNI